MTQETAPHVAAIYDWGRWAIQCPQCGNGLPAAPGEKTRYCRWLNGRGEAEGCGLVIVVDWPSDPGQIVANLAALPESRRHWEPAASPFESTDPATVAAAVQYAEAGLTPAQIEAELATPGDQRMVWVADEDGATVLEER